jgi:hypothetical protein
LLVCARTKVDNDSRVKRQNGFIGLNKRSGGQFRKMRVGS